MNRARANRSLVILCALVGAFSLACNTAGRAGPAGASSDARVGLALSDAGMGSGPIEPSASTAAGSVPVPPASALRPRVDMAAAQRAAPPLVAKCPQQFADARYQRCRWSTGTYRYCGGAAPPDGADQPREGCVCNECLEDQECNARGGGRCLPFPDEKNCGPPAKSCIYAGEPCAPPAKCKAPDRCMHDELGHAACSPPPVPHM